MPSVIRTSLVSLALGVLLQLTQQWLGSVFLTRFLHDNLITLLVALLAINSATMGIVLTKIRDLVEKNDVKGSFSATRREMILAVREQIWLIIVGVLLLIVVDSPFPSKVPNLPLLLNSSVTGVFVFALMILYDTAKGVLIIVDYDSGNR